MNKTIVFLFAVAALLALNIEGCQNANLIHPQSTSTALSIGTATEIFTPRPTQTPTVTYTPTIIPSPTNTSYPQPNEVLSPENADQIQQLARFGKGTVRAFVYSPDGKYLAIGTSLGVVIYDTLTWSETLIELDTRVLVLNFSPKGNFLGIGLDNGVIQVWRVPNWSIAETLVYSSVEALKVQKGYWLGNYLGLEFSQNAGDKERLIVFSPDEDLLIAAGWGDIVKVWQVSDGTLQKTLNINFVWDIAFNPNGKTVAIAASDVSLWEISAWEKTTQLEEYRIYSYSSRELFRHIAFSADGATLIGWSYEALVEWKLSDGKIVHGNYIPGWEMASVLSRYGEKLAIAFNDISDSNHDTLEIWDTNTAKKQVLKVMHPDLISQLAFNPNQNILAIAFRDGTIQVINTPADELLHELVGFPDSVEDISLLQNGTEIRTFTMLFEHPILKVLHLADGAVQQTVDLTAYGAEYNSKIAFSPDGSLLAVGLNNLQLWDFKTGKLIATLPGHQDDPYATVRDVAFLPDGNALIYPFDYNKLRIAKTSGTVLRTFENISFESLCIFDDGQNMMADNEVWNMEEGKLLKNIPPYYGRWFIYSSGCDMFVSMTWDGHFKVLRNTSEQFGQEVGDFDLRRQNIYFMNPVAFSPDRKLMAVQQAVGKIRIFDLQTNKTVAILSGHTDTITSLNFTLDGKLLLSSSRDGTIRLWGISP